MAAGTRERFLESTARLVLERGYEGASLNAILDRSGAPRGSLYHHFPGGKDQLVLEATQRTVDLVTDFMRECFVPERDVAAALRRYVDGATQSLDETDFAFGCPVAPLVLDGVRDDLARVCREALDAWETIVFEHLRGAGVEQDRAEDLASVVISTVEGALLVSRARRDTAPLERASRELAGLVRSSLACGPRSQL